MLSLAPLIGGLDEFRWYDRVGEVLSVTRTMLETTGLECGIGEICRVYVRNSSKILRCEVVAVRDNRLTIMPYGDATGVTRGDEVVVEPYGRTFPCGTAVIGRVVDALGNPIDGRGPLADLERIDLAHLPVPSMARQPISSMLTTGIRSIDLFSPIGRGQRLGVFAGSGVGKSTLLGGIVKSVDSDINVVALIGERGREVREFIETRLGEEGLRRSVVIVATADTAALLRHRAAYAAVAVAEYFRRAGKSVLLVMDSITRLAMAIREIGLAVGEPPTARGYTPSVFTEIPALCERLGTDSGSGSITGLMTVLVEGDDLNDPIGDLLRGTLDGHIILSRELANRGHFPAFDPLLSVSRVGRQITAARHWDSRESLIQLLAELQRNRDVVDLGLYKSGSNPKLDQALSLEDQLEAFLRQREGDVSKLDETLEQADKIGRSAGTP